MFIYTWKLRWKIIIFNILRNTITPRYPQHKTLLMKTYGNCHCTLFIPCPSMELLLTIFLQDTLRSQIVHDVSFGPLNFARFSSNCPKITESGRGRKTCSGRAVAVVSKKQDSGEQGEGSTNWQRAKVLCQRRTQDSIWSGHESPPTLFRPRVKWRTV